jgi:hypothetical protein
MRRRWGLCATALAVSALAHAGGAATAAADVGYEGPTFTANAVAAPSGQKPQSKLWFHDGAWWGSLFVPAAGTNGEYRIHRLDAATQTWLDTGTTLDDRNSSEADLLWDGNHLYVASSSDSAGVPAIHFYRYSYNASSRTYSRDLGPVEIGTNAGPTEAVVLEKDTTGRLWVTFAKEGPEDGIVYVSHTATTDSDWVAPFALPFPNEAGDIAADDISALVAYEGKIGVMWSNQTDAKIYFASHADGDPDTAWTLDVALEGPLSSDDHLNLKSLQADAGGRVFAAVKTSLGDAPTPDPGSAQVVLLVLEGNGDWAQHVFGTVANDHTRPIVLTDRLRRKLYVFATSPTFATDGVQTIYYKETSLDNPSFAPGAGQVFIQSTAGNDINDPSSTKQDLSSAPGLVVLASDNAQYWHNMLALGGGGGTLPQPPGGGPSPDRTRPVLRRVSVRPFAFRARRGSRLRFTLSERARVVVRIERRRPARRRGRFRFVRLRGGYAITRRAGPAVARLRGRLRRRLLRPGRYRVVLVAVDAAGNRSRPGRAPFRVRR